MTSTLDTIVEEFADFYAELHKVTGPYGWQKRLVRTIVETGRWPDQISAPTGAGKTCVIDIHVFLNALAGEARHNPDYSPELATLLDGLPRRLALLAPRRALVDDQSDVSTDIQERIQTPTTPLMGRIQQGLEKRAGVPGTPLGRSSSEGDIPVLLVDTVRGGLPRKRFLNDDAWQTHPTYCAVIHMTPEMFGSAILFRHYGAGKKRRPQDAGLLAVDTVAVVDEGHLQRQLLLTARRVGILDQMAPRHSGRPALEVVATTATPSGRQESDLIVEVTEADLEVDGELRRRLYSDKSVEIRELRSPLRTKEEIEAVVGLLLDLGDQAATTDESAPIGFVANTVGTALAVTAALRTTLTERGEDPDSVFSVVGRMRPADRQKDLEEHPGVLTPDGNPEIRYIVSTQVLEVGVDLDLFALVTELASPNALAQRAGRVNRRGERTGSRVIVLTQPKPPPGPYSTADLQRGLEWVKSLEGNINPWSVHRHPVPESDLPRRSLQRLELWDGEFFAATSEQLVAEKDGAGVELWTKDSFDQGLDVSIVVRGLPPDDAMASKVLELLPPEPLEMLPAGLSTTRKALDRYLREADSQVFRRYFVWNPLEKSAAVFRRSAEERSGVIRGLTPGSTVIVDSTAPLFRERVLVEGGTERLEDVRAEAERYRAGSLSSDVLFTPVLVQVSGGEERPLWEEPYDALGESRSKEIFSILTEEELSEEEQQARLQEEMTNIFRNQQAGKMEAESGTSDPETALPALDMVLNDVASPTLGIIVATSPRWDGFEESYEASSRKEVDLADHNAAVGERSEHLATVLNLHPSLIEALKTSGFLHDRGKEDLRFQAVLRLSDNLSPTSAPLAKSRRRSRRKEGQIRSRYDLEGWRHEQLSAAIVDADLPPDHPHRNLIIRLVGTSHGFGRSIFRDNAGHLIHPLSGVSDSTASAARRLFDRGLWESLIDTTHRNYGYWTCAYFEALLRGADAAVSGEGR